MSKSNWGNLQTQENIRIKILLQHPELDKNASLDYLIKNYYNDSLEIISAEYIESVFEEKYNKELNSQKEEIAKENYMRKRTDITQQWETLSWSEKESYINQVYLPDQILIARESVIRSEVKLITDITLNRIKDLERNGKLKNYNAAQIIMKITSSLSQFDYLSDDLIEDWKQSFGITNDVGDDELVDVYIFQSLDRPNLMTYKGNIGPTGEKIFGISKKQYQILLEREDLFDEQGRCINVPKLSAILGNVPLEKNPICIQYRLPKSQVTCSTGDLSTAYFGEFSPPLSTSGGYHNGDYIEGVYEAAVPSTQYIIGNKKNPNVEIISHSPHITTEELRKKVDGQLLPMTIEQREQADTFNHTPVNPIEFQNAISEEEANVVAMAKNIKSMQTAQFLAQNHPQIFEEVGSLGHGL